MTQVARAVGLVMLTLIMSCGNNRSNIQPVTALDPVGALRQFMVAVGHNDLTALSAMWGTTDGLAADRLDGTVLQQRLTVMQRYLVYEEYEVLEGEPAQAMVGEVGEEYLRVRLTRNNCTPVIPVTLVRLGSGWIVKSLDLTKAGNPQRRCRPPV